MIRLTRRYRFSASHRLHSGGLSETENRDVYGKCSNPYGHGHNYLLEVRVLGPVEGKSGRVVDAKTLDRLVDTQILQVFDQKNLNADVPAFFSVVPTTENLALETRQRLVREWTRVFPGEWPQLESVRIWETRKNAVQIIEAI